MVYNLNNDKKEGKQMDKNNLLLYAITDRDCLLNGISIYEAVEAALKGGATMLQLREKNIDYDEFLSTAVKIKAICKKHNVPLIINDNIDICIEADADGVHLGQGDTPVKEARKILGAKKIIGVTAKTIEQVKSATLDGADYIGSGAVFGTQTKSDAKAMSLETLKELTTASSLPVVAIGGIDEYNIEKLKNCGISGVAVVSGIFKQNDIEKAVKRLWGKVKGIV